MFKDPGLNLLTISIIFLLCDYVLKTCIWDLQIWVDPFLSTWITDCAFNSIMLRHPWWWMVLLSYVISMPCDECTGLLLIGVGGFPVLWTLELGGWTEEGGYWLYLGYNLMQNAQPSYSTAVYMIQYAGLQCVTMVQKKKANIGPIIYQSDNGRFYVASQ